MSILPVEGKGANPWSWFRAKLAMAVSGKHRHYARREIQRRHYDEMARRCSYGPDAHPIVQRLIEQTPGAIARVSAELPADFPAQVSDRIFEELSKAVSALEAMPTPPMPTPARNPQNTPCGH